MNTLHRSHQPPGHCDIFCDLGIGAAVHSITGKAIPHPEFGLQRIMQELCFLPEDSAKVSLETADTAEALPRGTREELCPRLEVLSSVKKALLDEAELRLEKCLELHDRIEAEYRPYMDFEGLNALGESLIAGLVGPG